MLQLAQNGYAPARGLFGARARLLGGLSLGQGLFAALQLQRKPGLDIFQARGGRRGVCQKGVCLELLFFQPRYGLLGRLGLTCLGLQTHGGRLRRRLGGRGLHLPICRLGGKRGQLRFQLAAPFARGGAFFRQLGQRSLQLGNAPGRGLNLGAQRLALGLVGGALGLQRFGALAACAQLVAQGTGRGLVVADVVFQHGNARVRPGGGLFQRADAGVLFIDAGNQRLDLGTDIRRAGLGFVNAPRDVRIVCVRNFYFALRLAHGLFRAVHSVCPQCHFQPFAPPGQL